MKAWWLGMLLGGLDDLLVDMIWIARTGWRRLTVYRRHARATVQHLATSATGPVAVFVPAWRESGVIGSMAATASWIRAVNR